MHDPKFKPGDLCVHVATRRATALDKDNHVPRPVVWFVLTSLVETCHGGTQVFYSCRGVTCCGLDGDQIRFAEIELELAPEE